MERFHVLIKGDIQGVFYRAFIKERAEELKLTGYTKNLDRDKIEIIVEGHEAKIKNFLEVIKQGPVNAEVEEFKTTRQKFTGEFSKFSVKY